MRLFQKLFAQIYDRWMQRMEKKVLWSRRQSLLGDLRWKILEIWSWTWVNFVYYDVDAQVIALEPSEYMRDKALAKNLGSHITMLPLTLDEALSDEQVRSWVDHIVCTLILCSIPELQHSIDTCVSLLKPWWTLIVLEHIRSHNTVLWRWQTLFTPVQRCVCDGCHLNRTTDVILRKSDLELVHEEYFGRWKTFYQWVFQKPA